jgi:hypothetical protein
MTPLDVMWVGLGGGLGSLLRWLTGRVVGEHYHGDFPAGTFLINVSGAFAIVYLSVHVQGRLARSLWHGSQCRCSDGGAPQSGRSRRLACSHPVLACGSKRRG